MSALIPLLILVPLISAVVLRLPLGLWRCRKRVWYGALAMNGATALVALILALGFDWSDPTLQARGELAWMPALGISFITGLDGMGLWLVLLTSGVLMPIVTLAAWGEKLVGEDEQADDAQQARRLAGFLSLAKLLEAAMLTVFVAKDALLFYAAFELTLLPVVFMIARHGNADRMRAALTFFFFAFTGSVFTLAGLLYVAWHASLVNGDGWSFELATLYAAAGSMSATEQAWVLIALSAGFLVKTPMFPVHTWLPLTHEQTPNAGSVDVAGLVLKLGPLGLLKLAIPLAPAAAVFLAPYLGVLACASIVFAALCAWAQTDAKKLLAYASISHMGFCLLGLFAFDPGGVGATGAIFYLLAHSLGTAGLFLCVGIAHDRYGTRDLTKLGGLAAAAPGLAFFFVLFAMTSVAVPGLNGFVGEFLTMLGTANSPDGVLGLPFAIVAATGVILAALYLLMMVAKIVWGDTSPAVRRATDAAVEQNQPAPGKLQGREFTMLAPLAVGCVVLGVFPQLLLGPIEAPVGGFVDASTEIANDGRAAAIVEQHADPADLAEVEALVLTD